MVRAQVCASYREAVPSLRAPRWAHALAAEHDMSVRFDGVGGGPMDEVRSHTFHGPGPSTQIAVFVRREGAAVPPSPVELAQHKMVLQLVGGKPASQVGARLRASGSSSAVAQRRGAARRTWRR